jgi:hypothetical protein
MTTVKRSREGESDQEEDWVPLQLLRRTAFNTGI